MPNPSSIVVVGGGLAGAKTVEALRSKGYEGPLTLLAAEDEWPYERPPLSKDYLQGKAQFDDSLVLEQDWYARHDVDVRRGVAATAIRPAEKAVELADGTRVGYDALVLATGSEPRVPDVPGGASARTLRTRTDSDAIKAALHDGQRVVIIGAGWIGLEVAAAARTAGCDVVVLEATELPLLGVLGREMAGVFADLHREHGVDLRPGVTVTEIVEDGGRAVAVGLADGSRVDADLVVAGIGAAPRLELAYSAGIETGGGVLVDTSLRSSDPDIYAVGDIAEQWHPVLDRRVRVEHWATALNQPAIAADAILGGDSAYDRLPYFYSDQFDLGMEYVGLAAPGDYARVIVRGDLAGREFVAFWLDAEDHVLAAMNVNVWDVQDDIKPLIANRVVVDVGRLADTDVALSDVGR